MNCLTELLAIVGFVAGALGLDIGSELLADVLAVDVEYTFFLII